MRLEGETDREGRVEMCIDGEWGTVCGRNWTQNTARDVCRHLGFSDAKNGELHLRG